MISFFFNFKKRTFYIVDLFRNYFTFLVPVDFFYHVDNKCYKKYFKSRNSDLADSSIEKNDDINNSFSTVSFQIPIAAVHSFLIRSA